jgi:hypothetical protein
VALIEAVLTYRPHGTGGDAAVPIATTDDPRLLRAIRDQALKAAFGEAHVWQSVDPGIAAMKRAEAERLAQVLGFLLPEEELRPGLRVVTAPKTPTPGGSGRASGEDNSNARPDTST